jgi:hypothetical protein
MGRLLQGTFCSDFLFAARLRPLPFLFLSLEAGQARHAHQNAIIVTQDGITIHISILNKWLVAGSRTMRVGVGLAGHTSGLQDTSTAAPANPNLR